MNLTITEIKPIETSLEILVKNGIELDLDTILAEEIVQGMANDLDNPY